MFEHQEEQDKEKTKKRPLNLTTSEEQRHDRLLSPKSSMSVTAERAPLDGIELLTDQQLDDKIQSARSTYESVRSRLVDNGQKLLANLKRLEAERERRKLRRVDSNNSEIEKPTQSTSSNIVGIRGNPRGEMSDLSQAPKESEFASLFTRKLEDEGFKSGKANDKKASTCYDGQRMDGEAEESRRGGGHASSRNSSIHCISKKKHPPSYDDQRGSFSSSREGHGGKMLLRSHRKESARSSMSNVSKHMKEPAYVLLDEDEPFLSETTQEEDELSESVKDVKIYYPSREDPEAVEICYSDLECLSPEGYLSSTIMNFYIRYLQQQACSKKMTLSDYHFFNTYFYKKLREAVSYKGSDKEAFFVKFRRWWKGVNIFQKAYILIPIHEDQHWSLVIICIPDKEDESGPILLHLDSLGMHHSGIVFKNIKSYLREEWNYLKQEVLLSEVPFTERIWLNLPRRVEEKPMPVPQQKNDYDCGLFVLYFMERFIEEAPERLKKKDLAMFGKKWFRPEEASGLRREIRTLLKKKFKRAKESV